MKGGVRKRGKAWSYYFDIGVIDGKRKKKEKGGFRTKGEASKALNEAMYDFENGGYIESKKITFNMMSSKWLEEYVKPLRKITTYNRYSELAKKYLNTSLGPLNLNDIKPYHIEDILLKHKNEISGSTLQSIYTLINTIMNRAIKLKLIKENPCKFVERPKRNKPDINTLDVDEIFKIYSALDLTNEYDYMFSIALDLTLELGLRRGELGGLEWENIDCKDNLIYIKNNLVYTNGYVVMETPKTEQSERAIYISDELLEKLKSLKLRQKKYRFSIGDYYVQNYFDDIEYDLIMKWNNGKYIHPMYYTNKITKVLKKVGIDKKIRFHDMRHTNATLLISEGVDFKTVQTRLGHKDINTTLNVYSHVNKEMQKNATKKLKNILGGKTVAK